MLDALASPRQRSDAAALPPLLRQAYDAVTAPLLVHAGEQVLYANEAMLRLLSHDHDALLALRFDAWAAPQCRLELYRYGLRCLHENQDLHALELLAETGSGTQRTVELTARAVNGEHGRLVVFSCQDLSDIRHVQTSLLSVGRLLHQIIEATPTPTFVIDQQHRVTHWNSACALLTRTEAAEVLGRDDAWKVFYKEAHPLLVDQILDQRVDLAAQLSDDTGTRRTTSQPQTFAGEDYFPQLGEDGRWLQMTAAPLADAQGHIVGAIGTFQDVTQRRLVEDELLRHRNELKQRVAERTAELRSTHHEIEAFLENAPVGILSAVNGRVTRGNRKFRELFELRDCPPQQLSTSQLFHQPADFEALQQLALPAMQDGQSSTHELEMRTLGGASLWVQLIAYVVDPLDPTGGSWWLLQDRTEVRRVQQELQLNYERIKQTNARLEEAQNQLLQSEKMASIGQLAAGVAHEINNPIGYVSSNLRTLRKYVEPAFKLLQQLGGSADELPPALRSSYAQVDQRLDLDFVLQDLPQLLDESEEGLYRVRKIVQDLKDFSRVDHADWQEADLNAGLDSTLNVVMNEVKYKAEVHKRYQPLPRVRCIAAQLNQVFMNLIVNAAQAIKCRGIITLSTWTQQDWVCVEVRDTGSGMSEDVKRRIFEPFFTTKPVGQGTGLGLSLSFSIVQKHGGRIELDSEPGQGTSFRVWIPVTPPAGTPG